MRNNDGFWGKAALLAATALTSAAVTYLTTRQAQPATQNVSSDSTEGDLLSDQSDRNMANSPTLRQSTQKGSPTPPLAPGFTPVPSSDNLQAVDLKTPPRKNTSPHTQDHPQEDEAAPENDTQKSLSPQTLDNLQRVGLQSPPPSKRIDASRQNLGSHANDDDDDDDHTTGTGNRPIQHHHNFRAGQYPGDRGSDCSSSNGSHLSNATKRALKRKRRDFTKYANHTLIAKFIEKLYKAFETANKCLAEATTVSEKTWSREESSTTPQRARSEQQRLIYLTPYQATVTNLEEVLKSISYANPEGFQNVSDCDIYFGETRKLGKVMLTQHTQFTTDVGKTHNIIEINHLLLELWESSDTADMNKYLKICKNTVNIEIFAKFYEEFSAYIEEGEVYENPSLYGDEESLYAEELLECVDKCEEVKEAFIDLQEKYEQGKQLRNSSRRRSFPYNSLARTLSTPPIDEDRGVEHEDVAANQGGFRGF